MSVGAVARGACALVVLCVASCSVAAQTNDAANAIAERFARDADAPRPQAKPSSQSKAAAPKQDAQRKQEAQRKTAEDKRRAAAEAARRSAEQRGADEADMLVRARREAEEMKAAAEQAQLAEEARRLIIEAEQARANAERLIDRQRQQAAERRATIVAPDNADAARREAAEAEARRVAIDAAERAKMAEAAEAGRKAAEAEKPAEVRREETRRLIEKLNRVRQIREARLAAQQQRILAEQSRREAAPPALGASPPSPPRAETQMADSRESRTATGVPTMAPPIPAPTEPRMALGGRDRVADRVPETYTDDRGAGRFTVLLIVAPGNYGIRRNGPKVADPILCAADGCFVSEGADRPAHFLPVRKALGFGNTFGARAGACRQRLGCVFRGIDLGDLRGYLQPVDLHILRHDRRRPQAIPGDSDCRINAGRLACARGIYAEDYAMWIVPERLADAAGPLALEQAVADGLKGPRSGDIFSLLGR